MSDLGHEVMRGARYAFSSLVVSREVHPRPLTSARFNVTVLRHQEGRKLTLSISKLDLLFGLSDGHWNDAMGSKDDLSICEGGAGKGVGDATRCALCLI